MNRTRRLLLCLIACLPFALCPAWAATRFYFPETEACAVDPTDSAEWEHTAGVCRRAVTVADSSTLTTTDYSPDGADHLVDGDALFRQYVSDPVAAQTIGAQAVSGQFQTIENNAGNNIAIEVKLFIVSNDGGTIKETLLAITRDGTESATALTNRTWSGGTTSSADVEDGDRIVLEIGQGGAPTAAGGTQGHNGDIRWGCNASGGDLPVNDTDTGTTLRAWIEFANTITFQAAANRRVLVVN
jgi:hypothetical protein